MRIEYIHILEKNDVQKLVSLIAETYNSSIFSTGRAKREFNILFPTCKERNTAKSLMKKCRTWWLKTGCPDEIRLVDEEFIAWQLLETYCRSLMLR